MVMDFKTTAELDALSIESLVRSSSGITNVTPGARARVLLEIVNRRLGEVYNTLKLNVAMGFLPTASGVFLDLLGALTGVTRRSSLLALTGAEDRNIKFYVTSGTLKAKIPSGSIASGTIIQNTAGSIQYRITETIDFDDVTNEVYVSAAAITAGRDSNVGANVLTVHDLGVPDVLVTNEKGITNGSNVENDDNYRYRISNSRALTESANLTAIRLAMLPVPGVADIVMSDKAGLVEALVVPSGNLVTESTVRACQFLGEREKAGGVRLIARPPVMIPYEIYLQVQPKAEVPSRDYAKLKQSVRDSVLDYFDDIPLSGTFVVRQLQSRVQTSDPRVFDHRLTCINLRRRPQLFRNYKLRYDELFMPDPQSENAITVAIAA